MPLTPLTVKSNDLRAACKTGEFAPLRKFKEKINNFDERSGFLLQYFVQTQPFTKQHIRTLPRLITELGANVNLSDPKYKNTALHSAALNGNIVAVKILLDNGALIEARNRSGETPLYWSCSGPDDNFDVLAELISRQADIHAMDSEGHTALFPAMVAEKVKNIRLLLENNASLVCLEDFPFKITNKEIINLLNSAKHNKHIENLLTTANPLKDAIKDRNVEEAKVLTRHPKFTIHHLEEGCKYAFTDESLRNDEFIFILAKAVKKARCLKNNADLEPLKSPPDAIANLLKYVKDKRIENLLTQTNPLKDAISSGDVEEASMLMDHPDFTTRHLEEGFRYAFTDKSLLRNNEFIFSLFAKKTISKHLVKDILSKSLKELKNLEWEIREAQNQIARPPSPPDFDLGHGDWADRAQSLMDAQNYYRTKDILESRRIKDLEYKIQDFSQDKNRIENQIAFLKRFLNQTNAATELEPV